MPSISTSPGFDFIAGTNDNFLVDTGAFVTAHKVLRFIVNVPSLYLTTLLSVALNFAAQLQPDNLAGIAGSNGF
jgi:hypothetical protein